MDEIGSRLKEYLDYKGVKRSVFADECNIPYNSLTRILNNSRNVSSEVIGKIFNYFPELNARWLITGKGPMEYSATAYYLDPILEVNEVKKDYQKESDAYIESLTEEKLDKLLDDFIQKEDVREAFKKMMKESLGMVPEKIRSDGK